MLQFLSFAVSLLLMHRFANGKEFELKVAGKIDLNIYSYLVPSPDIKFPDDYYEGEYLGGIHIHKILPDESMWLTYEIRKRGSQQIGLCLRQFKGCEMNYDGSLDRLTVTGDEFDMDGFTNYEKVLQVQKPQGLQ